MVKKLYLWVLVLGILVFFFLSTKLDRHKSDYLFQHTQSIRMIFFLLSALFVRFYLHILLCETLSGHKKSENFANFVLMGVWGSIDPHGNGVLLWKTSPLHSANCLLTFTSSLERFLLTSNTKREQ